ncbi:hypothetical protein NW768_011101 [Fusarium equiseti]|uniref:Mitochondrial chaperone bcs1 n=1 Tax=Fusarium equiseti TaxID=61235 RepID=A0ABQ8QY01_FUSEQ|nr:hypothetical protein NW768_011101 [Fusarium equiseti]
MEDDVMGQGLFIGLLDKIFPGLTYLPYFAIFAFIAKNIFEFWSESITARFISTVEISAHDETYNYLMNWVSQNGISKDNYRLRASATLTNEGFTWSPDADEKKEANRSGDDEDPLAKQITAMRSMSSLFNVKPIYWTPALGTHFFRYENRILAFSRGLENQNITATPRQPEKLAISCLGRDATILKRLLYNARIDFLEKQKGKTSIFRATKFEYEQEMTWTRCMAKATRPISTIVLDDQLKQNFIKDLRRYLDPQTKHWYVNRGIPYRRGYLFAGPPGTGKTSLTFAAAGLMGLDIYMVNLNSPRLNEDSLASLFQQLPETCLVLLEDIDATELAQKRGANTSMSSQRRKKRDAEKISLSGLLNVIDGVGAQEGRVLVMTSNHTENIDPALLRPGRIDHTISFQLATSEAAEMLFKQMYDATEMQAESQGSEKKGPTVSESIAAKASRFGKEVPDFALSPAAIQGFLLTHLDDPDGALATVQAFKQKDGRATNPGEIGEAEESLSEFEDE